MFQICVAPKHLDRSIFRKQMNVNQIKEDVKAGYFLLFQYFLVWKLAECVFWHLNLILPLNVAPLSFSSAMI